MDTIQKDTQMDNIGFKSEKSIDNPYSVGEEIANAVSHGIGFLLGVAGLVLSVVFAVLYGNNWHIVSCAIYGSMLVLLYLASTVYHAIPNPGAKKVLKVIDHASVYLLIAGTYTPYTLVVLNGAVGWTLFGIIWGLAIIGIVMKAVFMQKWKALSVIIYIIMGWLVLLGWNDLIVRLPWGGIFWLLLGGILYSVGTIFYALKKIPFTHSIWHLFVLAGSICHFFSIILYVVHVPVG